MPEADRARQMPLIRSPQARLKSSNDVRLVVKVGAKLERPQSLALFVVARTVGAEQISDRVIVGRKPQRYGQGAV